MLRPCGIVYVESDSEVYLPLEHAEVHADIVDVSAIVTVIQQFWQYSSSALSRTKYVFPIPAKAAMCGFEMTTADGTTITAVAKEKEEARHEHNYAISQGNMTGLVEYAADDVFSISLGALPKKTMITTRVTYVLDLTEDDISNQVRLQLPMCIGMRYGILPRGMFWARKVPPHRILISIDVWMQGVVKQINSPTHPTVTILPDRSTRILRTARYNSVDFLDRDFVLIVTADGLDAPRCFAQRAPNGTVAMQLNIVPKFNLPPITQQEYVFLVDRSGSMMGSRMETAKRTLVMLLRALPSQGTFFNIFSFGTYCDGLWHRSVPYDEKTMETATRHIDIMLSNYGGTEIQSAITKVFLSRKTDVPTAVFVLTDGESYNVDSVINTVQRAVESSPKNAALRVFTLGIGDTTSSAMCEGIARVGNGICLMATTSESIIGKCSRLVRASRTYILKNVTVDWGVHADLFNSYHVGNSEFKVIRQAPSEIPPMYSGNRFIVFALIEDEKFTVPKEVVIRGHRDGSGEIFQFSVPVQTLDFHHEQHHQPLIPALAARRAIIELEDGEKGGLYTNNSSIIVRLGTRYQLASTYTSFVAVDKRDGPQESERAPPLYTYYEYGQEEYGSPRIVRVPPPSAPYNPFISMQHSYTTSVSSPVRQMENMSISTRGGSTTTNKRASSLQLPSIRDMFSRSSSRTAAQQPSQGSSRATFLPMAPSSQPMHRRTSSSSNTSTSSRFMPTLFRARRSSTPPTTAFTPPPPPPQPAFTPLALRSFVESYDPTIESEDPSILYGQEEYGAPRATSTPTGTGQWAQSARTSSVAPVVPSVQPDKSLVQDQSTEDKVLQLIRLQSFDGSFPATSQLLSILGGTSLLAEAKVLGVSEKAWATALAIAYLRKNLNVLELLEGLVEKAMDFISQTPNANTGDLVSRAQAILLQ